MKDKIVLVTGAGGGIGGPVARRFLAAGACVALHYRSRRDAVERIAATAQEGTCRVLQADFARSAEIRRMWSEFLSWKGSVDVVVNCAAEVPDPRPLSDLSEDAWDRAFQVNLKAAFLLSQLALRAMKERKSGRILHLSSIGVKFGGGATTAHYSASKAALEALVLSLAKEAAPHNVLVNAIRVGVTDTGLHRSIGRGDLADRVKLIPLKRAADPEEIASTVFFLASPESSFITGSVLTAAGGE